MATPIEEDVSETVQAVQVDSGKNVVEVLRTNPVYEEGNQRIPQNSLVKVSKIVHWREPIRTGLIFGTINFFYLLVAFQEYSVITLTSYLLLSLLLICLSYSSFVVMKSKYVQGNQEAENPFQ